MKRNRAAVVTTVSTVMLGAGWVAGIVGTALNSSGGSATIVAQGTGSPVATTVAPSTTSSPSPSATSNPSPSATSSPSPSATASAAPAPTTPAPVSGTFDGASVQTRYGSYQAELTITAGQITNVVMLQTGASDGTSRQISGYALPLLISAVLQQQTANVGYVSGASYTTQGFQASVQDAMAQAGLA